MGIAFLPRYLTPTLDRMHKLDLWMRSCSSLDRTCASNLTLSSLAYLNIRFSSCNPCVWVKQYIFYRSTCTVNAGCWSDSFLPAPAGHPWHYDTCMRAWLDIPLGYGKLNYNPGRLGLNIMECLYKEIFDLPGIIINTCPV
jgi:hypothetical protein